MVFKNMEIIENSSQQNQMLRMVHFILIEADILRDLLEVIKS